MVSRQAHNLEIAGSSPASATKKLTLSSSGSSSVGRARPCQGRGRGFKSHLPLKNLVRVSFLIIFVDSSLTSWK
jgi:hypothetical protein